MQDFFWLWDEYGKIDVQNLSDDALHLRSRLEELIQEETSA